MERLVRRLDRLPIAQLAAAAVAVLLVGGFALTLGGGEIRGAATAGALAVPAVVGMGLLYASRLGSGPDR
jgi:hypothetical protein